MPIRKIRVLHLLHSMGVGGTERRVLRLALGLDPQKYDIQALSLRPTVGPVLPWPSERHTFFPIPSGIHWTRLSALTQFMRKEAFDVVHTHNWATMFYGVLGARLARVPVVLHGEHGRNDADRIGISRKREFLAAMLARVATKVVAVNEAISDDVRTRWKLHPSRVVCVPNGVNLSRFLPITSKGGGHDGTFMVGTVARFDGIKNLPCLIRAVERVCREYPGLHVRLVMVGSGPELDNMYALAKRSAFSKHIEIAGETDSPEQWYPRFDLFANTSFSEGMSNSVLEAMACGLPIVASSIAGNRCWLHEGGNALFFPSNDDAALARCIVRLASDRALGQRMGAENLRRVQAEYDNNHFLDRYDALYRQLLAHP